MKIGIITDIHEDAERLQYVIKELEKLNCDEIACLGDISGFDGRFYSYGFSRNLKFCMDVINVNCRVIIPGNHDLFHMKKLPGYNSIFNFPDNWYDLTFEERKKLSKGKIWLYDNDFPIDNPGVFSDYYSDLSDMITFDAGNIRILFTHSIAPDISGVLRKKPNKIKDFQPHFDLIEKNKCHIGISGHLHPNGLLKISRKKIHTPKFSKIELSGETVHFICPCVANGMQDNGFTIINTSDKTIEAFPIRTPKYNMFMI